MIRMIAAAAVAALAACSPQPAAQAGSAPTVASAHPVSGLSVVPLTVITPQGSHTFQVEVARSAYSRLRERGDTIIEPGLAETAVERDLAVLARRFDDPVTAEWLVRRLRSRPDHFANTTIVRPSGRHALALAFATLGRFDEADYWFEGAAHLHTKCRVPLLLAETFVEWAAAVTDLVGNAGRASELLDHAQAIAERHTAPGIDERIRRERERAHLAPERVER